MLVFVFACMLFAQEYRLGPDSERQPGVPAGKVEKLAWNDSKVFPGTTRAYWIYVPAQYDGSKPPCLMVFQDGAGFVSETGAWRVPIVFDNLIQQGAMPVTIGVFVDPGVMPAASPDQQPRFNRSYEYDALGPRYARYLAEEILPEVAKRYKISIDPNDRAIAGSSSGGIAAFTVAWERPDSFRRVMSFVGSFTNLRGGDTYADLVRKMEPKPLRVFLQDGTADQSIYSGSWYLANQEMARSLEYAGYEVKFVVGSEGHNARHGGAILPDALRWLWSGYPKPITTGTGGKEVRHYVTDFLDPEHDWELMGKGYQEPQGLAVDRKGDVYFCDAGASKIYKIDADGKVVQFKENTGGARSLMFGADGSLYVAQRARKQVVVYDPHGKMRVLETGTEPITLAVNSKGVVYFTEPSRTGLWMIDSKGPRRLLKEDTFQAPMGVSVNPDESLLVVSDHVGRSTWSFHIEPDGGISNGEPFYHVELPDSVDDGPLRPGADAMTFDDQGHIYIATSLGIQICDQPGRVVGIIRHPGQPRARNVVFGGPDLQYLYVTAGDKVYRRRLRRRGVFPWQPVKLPRPQL